VVDAVVAVRVARVAPVVAVQAAVWVAARNPAMF